MFINRDLSYLYLPSACDLSRRFFLKSLSINVLFGNIDRKIGQVFPWGINTLTFPPKEWRAEPTPHSPPSREGSGGGGFGREPTPHCRVIYSYIHNFLLKRAPQWYVVVLKRAPQWRFLDHENELYLNLFTQKSAALPCSWKELLITVLIAVFSIEGRPAKSIALLCSWKWNILYRRLLKRAPQYRVLENGASFWLGIYVTILGIFCEFEGWQHLTSKALVSILLPHG